MNTHLDTITLSGADQSVTVTQDQCGPGMTQLPLFPWDKDQCAAFLTEALTIEDEMDRLRAQLQDLVTDFAERIPLRAMRTALKVVRARKKLSAHPKEPMSEERQHSWKPSSPRTSSDSTPPNARLQRRPSRACGRSRRWVEHHRRRAHTPHSTTTMAHSSTWEREKEGSREHLRSPDL